MLQKVFYLSLYVRNMYVGGWREKHFKTGPVKGKSATIVGQPTETQ
jgi:hypothetical protein